MILFAIINRLHIDSLQSNPKKIRAFNDLQLTYQHVKLSTLLVRATVGLLVKNFFNQASIRVI